MAQTQTQNTQDLILSKKAIRKIVKHLDNNEYYYYRQIPNSLLDILPQINNLWLNITEDIRIMRLEQNEKTFYLILLDNAQELYILRNDSRTFEEKVKNRKNAIINEIVKFFKLGINYHTISNDKGLYIVSDKPLKDIKKNQWFTFKVDNVEFVVLAESPTTLLIYKIELKRVLLYPALKDYSTLNSRLPFF